MRTIGDRYALSTLLGSGGSARVYRARDELLGVDRALKLLTVRSDEVSRMRLVREAKIMAALRHPALLHVYDIGTCPDGDYVVMDLAEGGSLSDRLDARGPLPPAEAIRHMRRVLGGLAAAHEAGVVHRDVKPQNILLDHEDQALLADFGIARSISASESRTTRTSAGLGSLCFMAPEQRLDARSVGPAADIYAVGCTLYALLCDENPIDLFLADPNSARWQPIPPELRPVIIRATRLSPEDRYPSATAMAEALAALDLSALPSAGAPRAAPPAPFPATLPAGATTRSPDTAPTQPAAEPPRSPWRAALLGAILALLSVGAWQLLARPEPVPPAAPAPVREAPPIVPPPVQPTPAVVTPPPEVVTPPPEATQPPRKATAPRVEPPPETRATSPFGGLWTLSLNGRPAELRLRGAPEALSGQITTFLNAGASDGVTCAVSGRYDVAASTLLLADSEECPSPGKYRLKLSEAGDAFTGTFTTQDGSRTLTIAGNR